MNRQLYMSGGIMNAMPREQFGIGSSLKKLGKKAVGAVKDIASSDLGKAALVGAAAFGIPGTSMGGLLGRSSFMVPAGGAPGVFGLGGIGNLFGGSAVNKALLRSADYQGGPTSMFGGAKNFLSGLSKGQKIAGAIGGASILSGLLTKAQMEEIDEADPDERGDIVAEKLRQSLTRLGVSGKELEDRVAEGVSEYTGYTSKAEGGRIGFDNGSPRFDIDDIDFGAMQDIMPKLEGRDDLSVPMPKLEGRDDLSVPMPGSESKANTGIEKLLAGQLELPFGAPDMITKQGGKFYGVYIQKDGRRLLFPMDKAGSSLALAEGGRIGYQDAGPVLPNDPTQPVNPFGPKPGDFGIEEDIPIKMASNMENDKILEALFEKYLDMGLSPEKAAEKAREEFERMSMMQTEGRGLASMGGRMNYAMGDTASENAMQAAGIEGLPVRQNPKGVKELDLRDNGGFIPPVGIKEKEDDIPAMLSNNEFVFTADAVRGMGDGDVELGAQRMYDQMKMLEKGGRV